MYKRLASYILVMVAILFALRLSVAGTRASPDREGGVLAGLTALEALPPGVYAGSAKPWVQVNANAFGLGDPSNQSPPYQNEDGFEVTVYNDQLYVGMEADDLLGARVWRTEAGVTIARSQADWEQVVDDAFGDVENNDHIDSLQGFGSHIYASTAQSSTQDGTEVWQSASGDLGTWSQVNQDGFRGDISNKNFKDMLLFTVEGTTWLCGGTMNWTWGAQVWCTTDGTTWVQKNKEFFGFGERKYRKVWSTGVMDDYLYMGTECFSGGACPGAVWRTDGTPDPAAPDLWRWEKVLEATANNRADILGPFDGHMYIGFDGGNGIEVWRSATGGAGTWSQVNDDGFGDSNNGRLIVDAGTIYNDGLYHNGVLYLATLNQVTGAQVWRTADGTSWTPVGDDGFGDPDTFAGELVSFNGYLYAWATNYQTGQKVLRTKVPICQQRDIDGPGLYTFAGVGAEVEFTEENLDNLEVCVYPDAIPEEPPDDKPVRRHYELNPSPQLGTFTADLTLSYADGEFAASGIGAEETTYLLRWTGNEWAPCQQGKRFRDTANNTVTCADVTAFSTWSIAGTDVVPTNTPTNTSTPTATPTATMTPTPVDGVRSQTRPVGGYGEPLSAIELLGLWVLLIITVLSGASFVLVVRG